MLSSFSKAMPILLLILLGVYIRKVKLLDQNTIDNIKKLVINLALPAVIFNIFLNMEMKKEYIPFSIAVFLLLTLSFIAGSLLNKINFLKHDILAFMVTATTIGLMGIPLYETVYGAENLYNITIFTIGHEIFAWVVYFNVIRYYFKKEKFSSKIILDFIRSPIILAISLGLLLNIISTNLLESPIILGIIGTTESLSQIATPLILIIIGYNLVFKKEYMRLSFKLLAVRYLIMFSIGYLMKFLIIDKLIEPTLYFNLAYLTFISLPPPFATAIYISEYSTRENTEIANNTIVLGTLISIIIFMITVTIAGV